MKHIALGILFILEQIRCIKIWKRIFGGPEWNEIAKYVAECDTYQRVKDDHLRPAGNLQPLSIPMWKWEDICMYFIVSLPRTSHRYNSI
jgi:hypothetical protein